MKKKLPRDVPDVAMLFKKAASCSPVNPMVKYLKLTPVFFIVLFADSMLFMMFGLLLHVSQPSVKKMMDTSLSLRFLLTKASMALKTFTKSVLPPAFNEPICFLYSSSFSPETRVAYSLKSTVSKWLKSPDPIIDWLSMIAPCLRASKGLPDIDPLLSRHRIMALPLPLFSTFYSWPGVTPVKLWYCCAFIVVPI